MIICAKLATESFAQRAVRSLQKVTGCENMSGVQIVHRQPVHPSPCTSSSVPEALALGAVMNEDQTELSSV